VNDQQAIGETRHFFQLRRHQQDRATAIAQRHELAVNKLDCADVYATCRLRNEEHFRVDVILAADDQFLLVATGKCARGQRGVARTYVEALDDLSRALLDGVLVEKYVAGVRRDWRTIMHAEDRVLREAKLQ